MSRAAVVWTGERVKRRSVTLHARHCSDLFCQYYEVGLRYSDFAVEAVQRPRDIRMLVNNCQ
jgi:hypothetical protein